jgi:hypothetical protein
MPDPNFPNLSDYSTGVSGPRAPVSAPVPQYDFPSLANQFLPARSAVLTKAQQNTREAARKAALNETPGGNAAQGGAAQSVYGPSWSTYQTTVPEVGDTPAAPPPYGVSDQLAQVAKDTGRLYDMGAPVGARRVDVTPQGSGGLENTNVIVRSGNSYTGFGRAKTPFEGGDAGAAGGMPGAAGSPLGQFYNNLVQTAIKYQKMAANGAGTLQGSLAVAHIAKLLEGLNSARVLEHFQIPMLGVEQRKQQLAEALGNPKVVAGKLALEGPAGARAASQIVAGSEGKPLETAESLQPFTRPRNPYTGEDLGFVGFAQPGDSMYGHKAAAEANRGPGMIRPDQQ